MLLITRHLRQNAGGKDTRKERRLKNKDVVYKGWSYVKETVIAAAIAKRTVKSHRTYMRDGGWWNSVSVHEEDMGHLCVDYVLR